MKEVSEEARLLIKEIFNVSHPGWTIVFHKTASEFTYCQLIPPLKKVTDSIGDKFYREEEPAYYSIERLFLQYIMPELCKTLSKINDTPDEWRSKFIAAICDMFGQSLWSTDTKKERSMLKYIQEELYGPVTAAIYAYEQSKKNAISEEVLAVS